MTERLYLLGHPIAHSKSPAMHTALYRKLGLPWEYQLMDCATREQAERFVEGRRFLGINITTPYKPLAFGSADIKAASAKLARGANVLAKRGESLIAYNMDGEGCIGYLEQVGVSCHNAVVVVCGSGPTALAILHSAAIAGAAKVVLMGRNKERTRSAVCGYCKEFGVLASATIDLPSAKEGRRSFREAYERTEFSYGSYRTAKQVFGEADLIVNATPLGMNETDGPPFDTGLLHEGQTVFDVVYGKRKTALVRQAEEQGCRAFDGSGMLVVQAIASARAFFMVADIDPDVSDDEMFSIMAHAAGFE